MKAECGVTIIIDSYNHERFVGETIKSALAQDHDPVQVIVIDDGSPDRSQEIIRSFGSSIETIFQANQGQVAACRNALANAAHDIVIFLDSDDLLEPDAVRLVANAWFEGLSKVQYCLRVIDENGLPDGNVFPKFAECMTPDMVRAEMMRTGSYPDSPTSGNAYSRHFLEIALPLLPRRNGFDGELNGIAPLYGEVLSINQPLGSYRIHGNNDFAQRQLNIGKFDDYLRHSEARVAFIREHYLTKGQIIDDDVLDRDLKYQEYALVVEKLGAFDSERPRHLPRVAYLALKAAWQAPHDFTQRLFRMLWMVAVAIAPRRLASALVEQRFIPGQRLGWITWLATLRQTRRPKAPTQPPAAKPIDTGRPSSSHV